MHKISFIFTTVIALLLLGGLNMAQATSPLPNTGAKIENPYAYATAASQKNGVILLTIHNNTDTDMRMTHVRVSPDIADRAELHTHIMDGDTMMMRQVDGYDISARNYLTLIPMGDHIMLMDLSAPLKIGDVLDVTLGFEDGNTKQIEVPVIAPGTKPEGLSEEKTHAHDHQDHSHH